ncbi:MAG: serine/threonine protein phosphatase [Nanoarchaeota archaeon]|nr:MAG: serine/threonine protein phosphatase [Nanoarchaeota archaeon]
MRTFAIGDIHGNYELLKKVLGKANFSYEDDKLIILGDIVDRGKYSKECIEELTKIKNKVFIIGNHDARFQKWLIKGGMHLIWLVGGGQATKRSYGGKHKVPEHHKEFIESGIPYHVENNCLFVHGGFHPEKKLEEQTPHTFYTNRSLIYYAKKQRIPTYDHVYVGHTTTQFVGLRAKPLTYNNLTLLDTGAGYFFGKLTLMDINSGEYWQAGRRE